MSNVQITALVIILLYMAATVALGLFISARKKKKQAMQSNDDFLMAGKSLGPVVLAATLFAANTGGASTTGIATNVYTYGLSACWYVIAAGIGFVLVSFIAPYFRRSSSSTVPEIISKRYGGRLHLRYRGQHDARDLHHRGYGHRHAHHGLQSAGGRLRRSVRQG